MERDIQTIAKKIWKMMRVSCFTVRKGVSKARLLARLITMMKQGKVAGEAAVRSLIFHHYAGAAVTLSPDRQFVFPIPLDEYEFSCSRGPASSRFRFPVPLNKRKQLRITEPPSPVDLHGQLRITKSPFPLTEVVEEDGHVDKAAEEFIMRFYRDFRRENATVCSDEWTTNNFEAE